MDSHTLPPEDLAGIRRDTEQLCALLLVALEILESDSDRIQVAPPQNGLLDAPPILRNLHQSLDIAGQLASLAADRIEEAAAAASHRVTH